jgi:hypothetical protein
LLDSGCSNHMTKEKKMFTNLEEYDSPIERIMFGDNNYGDVVGQGDIPISKDSSLTNVYLVDTLGTICCLFHNFVRKATIISLLMRV